jgi:hypothetical protein
MDKQTYLLYRSRNDDAILYHYYLEHHDGNRQKLSNSEFQLYIRMWANPLANLFFEICYRYDEKFNVITILDKDGKPIAYG